MYRFALSMTPDDVEAVAAQLYVEMLEAGFTRVGEFHYLHHDRDGRPYADIAEMARAHRRGGKRDRHRADAAAGLLRAFGLRRRAADRRASAVSSTISIASPACLKQAARRLNRFPRPSSASRRTACAPSRPTSSQPSPRWRRDGPIHIHVAEQMKEVEDCIAWSGARPVEWLLANADGRPALVPDPRHPHDRRRDQATWRRAARRRPLPDHRGQSRRRHCSPAAVHRERAAASASAPIPMC